MGLLVEGKWQDRWYDTKQSGGRFVRQDASFRNWLSADADAEFPAVAGRYHLYVSYACPWAHRTLIVRKLLGIEEQLGVSVVHPLMLEDGWTFEGEFEDPVEGKQFLHQLYTLARPDFTGRVTVPVLWDKQRRTIVSNESSEIIRMLGFLQGNGERFEPDLYPREHRSEIDALNADVYDHINNGVYKSGFATTQEAYEEAVTALFAALDRVEQRLEGKRFLVGDRLSEADVRLFTTLFRFDPVYHGHFKCNVRRLSDYPNLWRFTRRVYQLPGVRETCRLDHIKLHYHASHRSINPHGIVPIGPEIDYEAAVD